MSTASAASPAPRAPGLRANFTPRKEYQVFLARGTHTFTLPGRKTSVTADVQVSGEGSAADSDDAALDAPHTSISLSWDADKKQTFAHWTKTDRLVKTSQHGIVNEDRATRQHAWTLDVQDKKDGQRSLWAAIYAFWIRHKTSDRLAVIIQQTDLLPYIFQTGLGFASPTDSDAVLLDRSAFWQAAGAPSEWNWLQAPVPSTGLFPYTQSFTKSVSPPVLTTHPLRPPKPAPGSVLYSRFIFSAGQHLELIHIDGSNPVHFEAYKSWQNSERVNHGWRERGPDEHHRAYIAEKLADPHAMGVLVAWDGELAGYGEMVWSKEDGMAPFVGNLGNWDQATHLLIGEEKFRGKHRFTACMVSLKHACFLRDPRTDIVLGEPRYDLPIIPLLATFLPQDFRREIELPHKRAVFFVLHRDRFFTDALLE